MTAEGRAWGSGSEGGTMKRLPCRQGGRTALLRRIEFFSGRGEIERGQLKRLWLFNLRVSTRCVCPCSMSLELIVPLMLLKALRMNAIVAHLLE